MTAAEREARTRAIRGAMANLVMSPDFKAFIEVIREQREVAIEDACSDRVVSDQRASMAAVGEIRALKSIIAIYDEFVSAAADGRLEPQE